MLKSSPSKISRAASSRGLSTCGEILPGTSHGCFFSSWLNGERLNPNFDHVQAEDVGCKAWATCSHWPGVADEELPGLMHWSFGWVLLHLPFTRALLQSHMVLGSWAGPYNGVQSSSSFSFPKRATFSAHPHSSYLSLITLHREGWAWGSTSLAWQCCGQLQGWCRPIAALDAPTDALLGLPSSHQMAGQHQRHKIQTQMKPKGRHPPFLSELFALTQLTDTKRPRGQNWIPHNPLWKDTDTCCCL